MQVLVTKHGSIQTDNDDNDTHIP